MQVNKKDLNKSGIYCIRNMINNKVYIGKSKNIYVRIASHIQNLNKDSVDENRHLRSAWKKYGRSAFEYFVVEYLEFNEEILAKRELYWIQAYNAINRNFGYNLRMDSSTKMIVHEETKAILSEKNSGKNNPNYGNKWSDKQKKVMSDRLKEEFKSGERAFSKDAIQKGIDNRNANWKEHPEQKDEKRKKVSKKRNQFKFYQYTKDDELVKVWDSVLDILNQNPTYKRHNIYAACSGEKPSMYGFKWVKVLNDEIVQPSVKADG